MESMRFTTGDTMNTYALIGTAGVLELWHHKGRFGKNWRITNSETRQEIGHQGFADYPNLARLKGINYKLPDGTPNKWTKVNR